MDKLFFGKSYWKIHKGIDSAYPYLRGQHRIYWHDPVSALAIAFDAYHSDPNAQSTALLHLETDTQCSANPLYKAQLEFLAENAKRRRRSAKTKRKRKNRRKKTSPPDELEKLEQTMKAIAEIQKLTKAIRG
jgi:hypothetical protein